MKKYLSKISVAFLVLAAFASCEVDDGVTYDAKNGKSLAAFAKTSGNFPIFEIGTSITTVRVNVSTVSDVNRELVVEIDEDESTALPGQYSIDAATVVIPAGSHYGDIKITGNFAAFDGQTYKLVFNLISVEGAILEKDPAKNTFVLSLYKTCPFDPSKIVSYSGISYNSTVDPAAPVTNFTPVITKVSDKVYNFDTLWGTDFVSVLTQNPQYDGLYPYSGKITINDDFTLTIKGNDSWATGGTGTYDPCLNKFTYVLEQELFGDPFPVPVELFEN